MSYRILGSSYTNDIYTLSFDPISSSLTLISSVTVGHHPSWITSYPGDRTLIFACLEQSDGKIVVVKYDDEWKGKIVGEVPSGGGDPCSLLATNTELFVANYSSGSVSTIPISPKSPFLVATSLTTTQLEGSGPHERQGASHAHEVVLHNNNSELLVPDLGADKVWRFAKNEEGLWKINGHIQYEAGGGPRHIAIHDGFLYTLLELKSAVAKHSFPPLPKEPSFIAVAPTMSHPPPSPNDMLAAEILIPLPNSTYPTLYIYASNRNDPSPEGDIVSIFSDALELVAEVRTGLKHVRGMVFGGPDDKWLIAGGVNGGGVSVFERVDGGKGLKKIATNEGINVPTGFLWV